MVLFFSSPFISCSLLLASEPHTPLLSPPSTSAWDALIGLEIEKRKLLQYLDLCLRTSEIPALLSPASPPVAPPPSPSTTALPAAPITSSSPPPSSHPSAVPSSSSSSSS